MSGRYRTVALQAIGVAILAAFVFVAFLRPSEPGELSGIDVPNGGDDGPSVVNPDDGNDKKKKGGNRDKGDGKAKKSQNRPKVDDRTNGPRGNDSQQPGGGGVPQAGGVQIPPSGEGGPGDDQYTDLVSALMKQVGEPTLWREINDP